MDSLTPQAVLPCWSWICFKILVLRRSGPEGIWQQEQQLQQSVPKAVPGKLEWTFPRWALAHGDISQSTLLIPIKTNSQEKKLVPRDPLFFTVHQILLSHKGRSELVHELILIFIFWPCQVVCRILVSQPGIESWPSAIKAGNPNPWATREFPMIFRYVFALIYLFLVVLGLCCCTGFSLVVESKGSFLVVMWGPVLAVASLIVEHRLWSARASVAVAYGLSSCGSQALGHRLNSCDAWV